MTSLDQLNSKSFSSQLHTKFRTAFNGSAVALELVEIEEKNSSPKIELFIVRFRGPVSPRLEQRIHRLEHDALGTVEIFLTATGADQAGTDYEAVFHRLRQPSA